MILTFLLIFLITCGGTVLTYLYEKEDSLLVRLAAGNVTGAAIFATAGFLPACFFGLSVGTVLIALVIALLPLALLTRKNYGQRLKADLGTAKSKLEGANSGKILNFAYYVFVFVVLWFFFERAMFETRDGIFTGGSQNLGDLPFHRFFPLPKAATFRPKILRSRARNSRILFWRISSPRVSSVSARASATRCSCRMFFSGFRSSFYWKNSHSN
jgi:hypothetical protein